MIAATMIPPTGSARSLLDLIIEATPGQLSKSSLGRAASIHLQWVSGTVTVHHSTSSAAAGHELNSTNRVLILRDRSGERWSLNEVFLSGTAGSQVRAIAYPLTARSDSSSVSVGEISGLELWLKADAITGLVDNDPVATWEDSSSFNNDATQGTGASQPIYKTNILNGLPVVRFDAVDDGMLTANIITGLDTFGTPFSAFIVYNCAGSAVNRRAIQGDTVGFNWLMGPFNTLYRAFNGALMNDGGVVNGQFVISTYTHNGTVGRFWLNGSFVTFNTQNQTPRRIGLGASGGFAEPLNGDIAEILVYTGDKTSLRGIIESYLRSKYNL